jgi:hypothetical protein
MLHKCCHCGVNLTHVKHYLVVHGVLMPYCRAPECQESMKKASDEFDQAGVFAKVVVI